LLANRDYKQEKPVTKEIKSEVEIAELINEHIKQFDACKDVKVFVARIPDDGHTNWEVAHMRGSGTTVSPDCKRLVMQTVIRFRERYELSTDA
jgi:hypothetical protein